MITVGRRKWRWWMGHPAWYEKMILSSCYTKAVKLLVIWEAGQGWRWMGHPAWYEKMTIVLLAICLLVLLAIWQGWSSRCRTVKMLWGLEILIWYNMTWHGMTWYDLIWYMVQRWANSVFRTEYKYKYFSVSEIWLNTNTIRVWKFNRIQISFWVPLLSEYEYLDYSNNTEYEYE